MTDRKISLIVPFFNEGASLLYFIEAINSLVPELSYYIEVIFINDGSTDNSVNSIISSEKVFSSKIVSLSKNFGTQAATRAGLQVASGDFFMFFPADLQDPLEMIDKLFVEINKGYDIVAAQRKDTSVSYSEKLFSRFYCRLIKKFAVENYPPKGVDLFMFNYKIKEYLNAHVESNSSIFLQILSLGYKIKFLEYIKLKRKHGKSKWTLSKKIKLLVDSFVAFSYAPIRFVTYLGIMLFIVGVIWTVYILLRKIIYDNLASGWPTLLSVLLLGFGLINISLGIIAEYLWRTLDVSRNRPVFIIDEIIELDNNYRTKDKR